MPETDPATINIFVIYAREDKETKHRLLSHLNPLKDAYNLMIWHDDYIEPGQEWRPSIESRLAKTDLFLLLVSVDFMNSEFIHQVEFKYAIDRHKEGKSLVIPVIINYCQWDVDIYFKDYTFNLSELQVLPTDAMPVGDWKTPEQAFNNIAAGIRKVLTTIRTGRTAKKQIVDDEELLKEQQQKEVEDQQLKNATLEKEIRDAKTRRLETLRHMGEQKKAEEAQEPPEGGGIPSSKKMIYATAVIAAIVVLCFFIFRKPNVPIYTDPMHVDTAKPVIDNTLPVVPSNHSEKVKPLTKVDITKFTPSKTIKDAEVTTSANQDNPQQKDDTKTYQVTDIDGNVYSTVKIGKQVWMTENLRTTHYRNGNPIPNVQENSQWANLSTGAYCNINNDASNASTHGCLYNWYAMANPTGICPKGWHVPSNNEMNTLITYLGGSTVAGGKIKATSMWDSPNTGATNSSGFTAFPSGERWAKGDFANGNWAYYWYSDDGGNNGGCINLGTFQGNVLLSNRDKKTAISCRCIRD